MFGDSEVSAILCFIGGDYSNQLLPYIDWGLIKKNPKVFIGYSDISVLHHAIQSQTGLQTFYGPALLTQFAEYPDMHEYTKEYFVKAVMKDEIGEIVPSKYYVQELLNWMTKEDQTRAREKNFSEGYQWWKEGYAEGKIIG